MADEFVQIRDAMIDNARRNGKGPTADPLAPKIEVILDNQREILACMATLARGGVLPHSIARDLQERAKKITKLLEG